MPEKKKQAMKAAPAPAKSNGGGAQEGGQEFWGKVLDGISVGGGSSFIFPKDGKTRVRLVRVPKSPYYVEVPVSYRGQSKTKYLILAYSIDELEKGESEGPFVKGLMLAKTAFKSAVALMSEGYKFFDFEEGHGITITRSGTGRETNYAIIPSKNPITVPDSIVAEMKEKKTNLADIAKEYAKFQAKRASSSGTEGGEDEPADDAGTADEEAGW